MPTQQFMALIRYAHIAAALYNLVFIYSSLHRWEYGFFVVQWCSTPILIVTGIVLVRGRKRGLRLAASMRQPL